MLAGHIPRFMIKTTFKALINQPQQNGRAMRFSGSG
jgi:hypothetical protein